MKPNLQLLKILNINSLKFFVMKKIILLAFMFVSFSAFAVKINGVVKSLHYMNPNDTVIVSDEVPLNKLRVLYTSSFCFVDSTLSNKFKIASAGKYILQGYSTSGNIIFTTFEIKTKQLPAPKIVGLFSYCNNSTDTFFMQMDNPQSYGAFTPNSFQWYFSNSFISNSWPVEWILLCTLTGNYKFTAMDKNGNLFKSANTYVTCGNKVFVNTSVDDVLLLLNDGFVAYDLSGKAVDVYSTGVFILSKGNEFKYVIVD